MNFFMAVEGEQSVFGLKEVLFLPLFPNFNKLFDLISE